MFTVMKNGIVFQYLGAISANLMSFAFGMTEAWFTSNADAFKTSDSPLEVPPLGGKEVSWIGSLLYLGAVIGTVFLSCMADAFGRKNTLAVLVIPQIASCALIAVSSNATELYIARILSGFTAGGTIVIILLFLAEISDDRHRGRLLTLMPLFVHFGIFAGLIADYLLTFALVSYLMLAVPVVFIVSFTWVPDSPLQLMKNRKREQAIKSMRLYSNAQQTDECLQTEVRRLIVVLRTNIVTLKDFATIPSLKAFTISAALIVMHVICNCFLAVHYAVKTHESPNMKFSYVISSGIQLTGTAICLALIDRMGRRALLVASAGATSIGLFTVAIYEYLSNFTSESASLAWIPTLSYACVLLFSSVGIIPLTYVLPTEIIPEKIRHIALPAFFALVWFVTFFLMHFLESLAFLMTSHFFLLLLAGLSAIGFLLFVYVLPETNRKSYDDIFLLMHR